MAVLFDPADPILGPVSVRIASRAARGRPDAAETVGKRGLGTGGNPQQCLGRRGAGPLFQRARPEQSSVTEAGFVRLSGLFRIRGEADLLAIRSDRRFGGLR